jgi:GNAT superfamily N-acetyltransferase
VLETGHMDQIDIRPLTPDRLEEYLRFMEEDAFGGNPDWEDCYCAEAHEGPGGLPEEDDLPGPERRKAVSELIRDGRKHGLMAYVGDRMVGWCHAAPLAELVNPKFRHGRGDEEVAGIGSIVCFNLAESHRRQGLPGVLLRAAVERFADAGLSIAEAYPWKEPSPRPGREYLGTINLYELHGFTPFRETEDAVIMRRPLNHQEAAR